MNRRPVFYAACAALLTISHLSVAQTGRSGAPPVLPPGSPPKDTSWSSAAATARARATLDSIRLAVLKFSTFAGFTATDSTCAKGDMRTFENDTTDASKVLLSRFEQLVTSYGAFEQLDNESGRALMRAVVRLETGGPGPRWDVASGRAPRAFNPVLPGRMLNGETKACEQVEGTAPDGLVLPPIANFVAPKDSGAVPFEVGYGFAGLNTLRDYFFARHQNDSSAVLRDTRVNAYSVWGNYAVIGVVREQELRGVIPLPNASTGAVYAFHKVGAEWRILALIRTW